MSSLFMNTHDGDRGHIWKKTDYDGEIDAFGLNQGFHNGPICVKCGYAYCEHCEDGPQEDCVNV